MDKQLIDYLKSKNKLFYKKCYNINIFTTNNLYLCSLNVIYFGKNIINIKTIMGLLVNKKETY